jgi:hypothetical protein
LDAISPEWRVSLPNSTIHDGLSELSFQVLFQLEQESLELKGQERKGFGLKAGHSIDEPSLVRKP